MFPRYRTGDVRIVFEELFEDTCRTAGRNDIAWWRNALNTETVLPGREGNLL